jgi:quercetin dioxygenase-like cupin family protein
MAIPHAQPGQVIDLLTPGETREYLTQTLIKSHDLEVIRLILPAGKKIAEHKVNGEITVQCLQGRVRFSARGETQDLATGQMLYLAGGDLHALQATEDSCVLVTILL